MGTKTLAVIPARGGSKGLLGKNILEIAGKPLISWTIRAANSSKLITETVISTDDENIKEVAIREGGNVPFMRPPELAGDNSTSVDVVLHCLEYYEERGVSFDNIILLEPTSPLRKTNDIDNALSLFFDNNEKADGIISLGKIHLENPAIVKYVNNNLIRPVKIEGSEKNISRRQDYPEFYFPYGVLYVIKTEVLKESRSFYTERVMPYYIERWQNYEIDDIYDFHAVESILKIKIKEGLI